MGAETTYYALIPKIKYEWIEVSAVTKSDVWKDYPEAKTILHWTDFEDKSKKDYDGS